MGPIENTLLMQQEIRVATLPIEEFLFSHGSVHLENLHLLKNLDRVTFHTILEMSLLLAHKRVVGQLQNFHKGTEHQAQEPNNYSSS